jgi:hypothetical protein
MKDISTLIITDNKVISEINNNESVFNYMEERSKKLDYNLNNISYFIELEKTQQLISEFLDKLLEQMVIMAAGGNRLILEILAKEELNDFLFEEINHGSNSTLQELHVMYKDIISTYCGFSCILKRSNVFKNKEIDSLVEKMEIE